jgi:hypothetical protein
MDTAAGGNWIVGSGTVWWGEAPDEPARTLAPPNSSKCTTTGLLWTLSRGLMTKKPNGIRFCSWAQSGWIITPLACNPNVNIVGDNRNLFLGLGFALGAVIAWALAMNIYEKPLGIINSGGNYFIFSLEHVTQYTALFPGRSLQPWLEPEQANAAVRQKIRYRLMFTAALVSGFFTVFFLGLRLDGLRSDSVKQGITSQVAGPRPTHQ